MRYVLVLAAFLCCAAFTVPAMADDSSNCGLFDTSCHKPGKKLFDDAADNKDRPKDVKPQRATEPLDPYAKKKHRSLGDIQRDQMSPR